MFLIGELTRAIQSTSQAELNPEINQKMALGLGIDLPRGVGRGSLLLKTCLALYVRITRRMSSRLSSQGDFYLFSGSMKKKLGCGD